MIITLVLSSLVMILILGAFKMVGTYFSLSQMNREINEECISTRLVLKQDFIEADSIRWKEEVLIIYKKTKTINWHSDSEKMIREPEDKDKTEKAFLIGPHLIEASKFNERDWVTSANLHLLNNNKPHRSLTFYKDYPISNYIN